MLTASAIKQIFPSCERPALWAEVLVPATLRYEINTPSRLASFLAQVGHESASFNCLVECLRYRSAGRLMRIWPRRFTTEAAAAPYVNNEEKLANFIYANRLGNGNVSSCDGFRFRGRGLIQITGRSNYGDAGKALGLDLHACPELLEQPEHAAMSAAWYWNSRGLNALADNSAEDDDVEDFAQITRRINGGTIGLHERLAVLKRAEGVLA